MSRYAVLCPGQGGQHPAMFDLLRSDVEGLALLAQFRLNDRLGADLDTVLSDDQLLFSNRCAQVLVVAAGLASWHRVRDSLPAPELVAGYSIGELTAYGVADAVTPQDAIELAMVRADAMDNCLAQAPHQGLMSVNGLLLAEAQALLHGHGLYVAIDNGMETLIAGGCRDSLLIAQQQLIALGASAAMLPVGIASHTPLMQAAVAPFLAALHGVAPGTPAIPVLAGVSGQRVGDSAAACHALTQQLTQTLRWSACMDACAESGIDVALELGPGAALSRMLRTRHPHIECRSISEFRSIAGVISWLQNRLS